jgi:hypothetical protein
VYRWRSSGRAEITCRRDEADGGGAVFSGHGRGLAATTIDAQLGFGCGLRGLVGMPVPWGKVAIGGLVVVAAFGGALWASNWLGSGASGRRPALVAVPPLAPAARSSVIVAPATIALSAIHDAMERAAPRNLAGKRDNALPQVLSNSEINWTIVRGPLAVSGRPEGLAVSTALTGTVQTTGQVAGDAGNLVGALGGLLGGRLGQQVQNLQGKSIDQHTELHGNVTVTSRPALLPAWRVEPNLAAQVAIADASLQVLGVKLNVSNEVKPLLDRAVNEQVAALQARLRDDPSLELAVRREWSKMCRSIPLAGADAGMPKLWLELRPTRAFAAQPRINSSALILTLGVQAQTRIVPNETKPDCPFPARLELVPQAEQGRVNIAVPIDVPFTEVNRLLAAQLTGKTFPSAKDSAVTVTVRSVNLAASGDRLLISLGVKANENKSWFGLGAEATIHVWGRPVLDRARQVLRFEDVALDVESEAAFGLLGAAARAAVPYLEKSLAENATVDLAPLTADARKSIEAALADFRRSVDGVRVEAGVTDLRLVGIEFDATTLRVIAEADGTAQVAVTKLAEK